MYYRIGQISKILILLGNSVLSMEKGDTNIEWGKVRKNPVTLIMN